MSNRFVPPFAFEIDTTGAALAGGKLEFFESGTSTNLDTYSDESLTTANANPVVADSAGRFGAIFLKPQDYKVVLSTSADVQIWSADPVHGASGDDLFDDTIRSTLTSGGSTGAYTLTVNRSFTALANGDEFVFKINHVNPGAGTLNVTPAGGSALGAKNIIRTNQGALLGGEMPLNGWAKVKYDGTQFQLLNVAITKVTVQTFTASGTWTKPAGCLTALIRMVGGGGGGGGTATTGAGAGASAGGGGYGEYVEKLLDVSAIVSSTITIGAGGAGTADSNGSGGGNTIWSDGTNTLTANGGAGGTKSAATTGNLRNAGGAGGTGSSDGDVNIDGGAGGYGIVAAAFNMPTGKGGDGPFGFGPYPPATDNGTAGQAYGSGGSGATADQNTGSTRAGGAGAAGFMVVIEFY